MGGSAVPESLDLLDRLTIGYLSLPLLLFFAGWFETWAAVPLVLCLIYGLRSLAAAAPVAGARFPILRLQLGVAAAVACAWTICGGIGHLTFANADWHIRDAVLHDLVIGRWPVGYGMGEGEVSLLRAPIGYYLPAALLGKALGLMAAHAALALWTAAGVFMFLMQVFSRVPSRVGPTLIAVAVMVLFSGLDVVGTLYSTPGVAAHWDFTRHLEWWAHDYQYSSMTTQLFWVPNHALGGWLTIGLLLRKPRSAALESVLPMVVASAALWSPLSALGLVPFVLWRLGATAWHRRSFGLAAPRVWLPALAVGSAVAAYLTLDSGKIPRSLIIGRNGTTPAEVALDLLHHVEFFMLEAGLIGLALLAIRRSSQVILALCVLALLPLVSFGSSNDFVMRVSIPSLTVLAVASCLAFTENAQTQMLRVKRAVLAALLTLGAVTPLQEFARALLIEPWPINRDATLVNATCGSYLPHYIARLEGHALARVLRAPYPLASDPAANTECRKVPAVASLSGAPF